MTAAALPHADLDHGDDLDRLWLVYRDGQYRSLWHHVAGWGEPERWTDPDRCELAVRLLTQLGAPQRAQRLLLRRRREHGEHLGLADIHCRSLLEIRGPVAAWTFWDRQPIAGSLRLRAHWFAMGAEILLSVRDQDGARDLLAEAEACVSDDPWLRIVAARAAQVAEQRDRAEAIYRDLLAAVPFYRPAIQGLADVLQHADRADAAEALLADAAPRLESAAIWSHLAVVAALRDRDAVCAEALDRWAEECLLAEPAGRRWATGMRADLAARAHDFIAYRALVADLPDDGFYQRSLLHLPEDNRETRRIMLDVPYVAQSHLTCVPATLVALARYWHVPADHDEVADAICYDGTPDWRERRWAESAGFTTREFRVTWDSAVALLERGIPFTLTTTYAESGHLQAVVGYEAARRLFLLRDPGSPYVRAALATGLLEDLQAHGPRGMALIPRDRAHLLTDLELPESADYDDVHALSLALNDHHRSAAAAAHERLVARDPEGRLTLLAQRSLAAYDRDADTQRRIDETMAARYPDDWRWRLMALNGIFDHLPRLEVVARHRAAAAEPSVPVLVLVRTIGLLRVDPTARDAVAVLMRRLRARAGHHPAYLTLAGDFDWDADRRTAAARWYRFAALIDPTTEDRARTVFSVERAAGRSENALNFLRRRAEQARVRSAQPTLTLLWALDALGRTHEAAAAIAAQDLARGTDGEWLLGCARWCLGTGDRARADACIERARAVAGRSDLLRILALRCDHDADAEGAIAALREIANADPFDTGAVAHLLALLRLHHGHPAAVAEITTRQARLPHHYQLSVLRIQTLRTAEDPTAEQALTQHLDAHPNDAWALREAGFARLECGDAAGALTWAARALACLDEACVHRLHGAAWHHSGERSQARAAYRRALTHDPDDHWAIDGLLAACSEPEERRAEWSWFHDLLRSRVILGDALLAYARHAGSILGSIGALVALREAHAARPDLWQAWTALIQALSDAGHSAEAVHLAEQASTRFPRLPRIWFELARARRIHGDTAGEIAALCEALVLNPDYDQASRWLSEAYERIGDLDRARAVILAAQRHQPNDAQLLGFLADFELKAGRRTAAADLLARAVAAQEEYEWAWNLLATLDPPRAVAAARAVAERRPHAATPILRVARLLPAQLRAERRAALDEACSREPRHLGARRTRMRFWQEVGEAARIPDDLADPLWQGRPPAPLRCEAAELAAERGEVERAEREAEALVAAYGDEPEGRFLLGRIRMTLGRFAAAASAFNDLIQVAPTMALAHGWLGDALQRDGRPTEAKAALQRALDLDPTYTFAAAELVSVALAEGDTTCAEAALATLERHQPGGYTRLLRLRVALTHTDPAMGAAALTTVLLADDVDDHQVAAALKEFTSARDESSSHAVLERIANDPRLHLQAWYTYAPTWIAKTTAAQRLTMLADLHDAVFGKAAAAVIEHFAEKRRFDELRPLIDRFRARLRSDTMAWGSVGYAFAVQENWREVRAWLADWRQRRDVRPWMLSNLAEGLRLAGDWKEAAAVVTGALTLDRDHTELELRCWACIDAALAGMPTETPPALAEDHPKRNLHDLATIASVVHDAARRPQGADRCLGLLAKQRGKLFGSLGQAGRRLAKQLAPHASWWWRLRVFFW